MNIEAIRKRQAEFSNVMLRKTVDISELTDARIIINDLLSYISELESKLRWRKVEEEKPPLCREILLKNRIGTDVQTLYAEPDGRLYFLYRDKKIYPQDETTEWREI